MASENGNGGERFTGHGSEWQDANLSKEEAHVATVWVDQIVNRRSMLTNKNRVEDVRDAMWELEKDGEIVVHRVTDEHKPVMVKTLYGWDKKIPSTQLWHHKSCGQCGNIPGYPASLLWLMNEMDIEYLDETDQTSCTAWNYHGSGIGNLESLAAVFLRNFHQAYVSAKAQGLPEGYYYPLVHCGTSFGNYKEVRGYLIQSAKLRERVKKILGEIAKRQVIDCSHIRATVHPACHVYKMVPEDAIYDDNILGGNRVAVTTSVLEALGSQVIDYRTWYDCCGFGFRHIISEREFTRSFAIDRKIRVAQEEARADMMVGHDTGCITTLDKNQWIGAADGKAVDLPVLADCQFAALVCGAHPYKIVQSHWHASSTETLMEKLGIDWEKKKAEFEAYLKDVEAGKGEMLYDPRKMITSGPGFKPIERLK
jgi:heterodisulfide reductase subunit B